MGMLKVRLWRKNIRWLLKAGRGGVFEVVRENTTSIVNKQFCQSSKLFEKIIKIKELWKCQVIIKQSDKK